MAITLFDRPHAEIRDLLRDGAPVWMTVNPVEYHGPHLSLHNDVHVSRGLVRDVHATFGERWPLLLAEDLEMGVNPTPGPGSRHTPFQVVKNHVIDACERLADLGAQRIGIMTFHGDPLHSLAIEGGVLAANARGVKALSPFNRLMRDMLTIDPQQFAGTVVHLSPAQQKEVLSLLKNDFHAGFFETAVTLHYAPETVGDNYKALPPCPPIKRTKPFALAAMVAKTLGNDTLAQELAYAAAGTGWHLLDPFPGYTSYPSLATKEAGAIFAREMVAKFAEACRGVWLEGAEHPKPIMTWSGPLSFGGRVSV